MNLKIDGEFLNNVGFADDIFLCTGGPFHGIRVGQDIYRLFFIIEIILGNHRQV